MSDMLTIIVPVYKIKEEFLRYCIESLLNQGRNDYKIILVDDGSPDDCGTICDEYASKYSIISVIHQKNQGVSTARNNAIKAANTKWITFVDADDWVEKDYVNTLYQVLSEKAFVADIVMYNYTREYKNRKSYESFNCSDGKLTDSEKNICKEATYYKHLRDGKLNPYTIIAVWNKVYSLNFLQKNDLFFSPTISKGEDRIFNFLAFQKAQEIYYLNKGEYHYRCWEESTVNRYNPKIVNQTEKELLALMDSIKLMNCDEVVQEKFRCRICTRMYSCMRLYIFHEKNQISFFQKMRQAKQLSRRNIFRDAIKKVNLTLLSTQEKIFTVCVKFNCFFLVYLLVKIKNMQTRKQLN